MTNEHEGIEDYSIDELLTELNKRRDEASKTLEAIGLGLATPKHTNGTHHVAAHAAVEEEDDEHAQLALPMASAKRGRPAGKPVKAKPAKASAKTARVAKRAAGAPTRGPKGDSPSATSLILDALKGGERSFAQVMTHLNAKGWKSDAKKPELIVRTALFALSKKGQVVSAGRGVYTLA